MAPDPIVLADATFLKREGLKPEPEPWEDGWRTAEEDGAFEWWYFDLELPDETTAVLVFTTKDPVGRSGPLAPSVRIAITPRGGTLQERTGVYKQHEFKAERDHCDVRIGPNYIRDDAGTYRVSAEVRGLGVDLTFTPTLPPWRPDAGRMYFRSLANRGCLSALPFWPGAGKIDFDAKLTSYFAWLAAVPRADVQGTLTYGGGTRRVTGLGYHDHNWGNVDLHTVLSYWYWGRAYVGDDTLIFADMVSTKPYGRRHVPIYMVGRENQIVDGGIAPLLPDPKGRGCEPALLGTRWLYPKALNFNWRVANGTVGIALRRPRVINSIRLRSRIVRLKMLPWWKQFLLWLLFKGHYYRFRADAELRIRLKNARFDIDASPRGRVLYELFILG